MKRIKMLTTALFTIIGLNCMPVMAAEVTPTDAYLWTNGTCNIQVDDTAEAAIVEGPTIGKKLHITGVTTNGYWQVDYNGVPAYIPGAGLGDVVIHDGMITKYYDMPIVVDELATIIINSTDYTPANGHFAINGTAINNTNTSIEIKDNAFSAGYANGYDWDTATIKKANITTWGGTHNNTDGHNIECIINPTETKQFRFCYDTVLEGTKWSSDKKYVNCTQLFKLNFEVADPNFKDYRTYNITKFYDYSTVATKMEQIAGIKFCTWNW